jgi:hypothetical protein
MTTVTDDAVKKKEEEKIESERKKDLNIQAPLLMSMRIIFI